MKKYEIDIVPGDGIGHEIVPAGIEVLNALAKVNAFELTLQQGVLPVDLGGSAKTIEIADAVVKNLHSE